MKIINVDEAAELTLQCKKNRTFDLTVNLNRDTLDKSYKLQVNSNDTPLAGLSLLTFTPGDGLTINPRSLTLLKSPHEMDLPTGCYQYDLVEISGDQAENVFFGWFIVEPSFTTIP